MHSLAVLAIFATTVAMVITRPYRLSEGISASLGAAGILALGDVTLGQAAGVLSGTLNILGFFLGMMTIQRGLRISVWQYLKVGAVVAPVLLAGSGITLWAALR